MKAQRRSREGFSGRGHFAAGAAREPVLDARRCTVQLANGRLYLDAAATSETALLGHDNPEPARRTGVGLGESLERLDPRYIALAVRRDLGATERLARRFAARLRRDAEIVDASAGQPGSDERTTIAIENETLGRTGLWFASAHWSRRPEFVVVGPALARGRRFAALLADRWLIDALGASGLVADPSARRDIELAERVAAVLDHVEAQGMLEHGRSLAEYLDRRLRVACSLHPDSASLQSNRAGASILRSAGLTATQLQRRLCERGVLVGVAGEDAVVIHPPLPMRLAEVDVICGALRAALGEEAGFGSLACCASCQGAMNALACSEA